MSHLHNDGHILEGEKKSDQTDLHVTGTDIDTPEYLEFVALNDKYQGDLLAKLTVSQSRS
jgi:hypothetical protein